MPQAGELRDRFLFSRRALDDNGDRLGAWGADALTVWAKVQGLRGGEGVQAARLQGRQPVILTIRASAAAKLIDNAWRALDAGDGSRAYDIQGVELSADRAFLEILATRTVGQTDG